MANAETPEQKLEFIELTVIETMYNLFREVVKTNGRSMDERQERTITLCATVLAAVRTGKASPSEEALVSLATTKIKEQYNGKADVGTPPGV